MKTGRPKKKEEVIKTSKSKSTKKLIHCIICEELLTEKDLLFNEEKNIPIDEAIHEKCYNEMTDFTIF